MLWSDYDLKTLDAPHLQRLVEKYTKLVSIHKLLKH